jgi:hypothetical protein
MIAREEGVKGFLDRNARFGLRNTGLCGLADSAAAAIPDDLLRSAI